MTCFHGGPGFNTLNGGEGVDTASYAYAVPGGRRGDVTAEDTSFGRVVADLEDGFAQVFLPGRVGFSRDQLILIENIVGGLGNDELRGDGKRNSLTGGAGNDFLEGRGDRDTLIMGEGDDTAIGGSGNDRVVIGPGRKTIDGGSGTDSLDLGTFSGEVTIDFAANRYTASFDVEIPVWADSGGVGARVYNGNRYTPSDVQESEAEFANDRSDLSRELPPEPTDPEADRTEFERFKIAYKTKSEKSSGSFESIEKIIGGTAAAVILPSLARDRFDGRADAAARDTIDMSGEVRGVDFDLRSGKTNNAKLRGDDYKGIEGIIGTRRNDDLRATKAQTCLPVCAATINCSVGMGRIGSAAATAVTRFPGVTERTS